MNAYADITDLPNHIIPPVERHTRKTNRDDLVLFAFAAALIAIVALGTLAFGPVMLGMTALVFVPVMMGLIVMITLG
ncbi:hypothetical protein ORIO_03330 [Cereibacter azotoformans]|uniref:Uncharacterized protein n=2 Tax=Cereibacter TaxID=1653176 RepID=A0A2T5K6U4_9RHOB|nr:hypothetical protein [Cereibacter azotoformans]AXQ92878.1 hypothetical protein D0Z66_02995 [Cereibacter sphaeroides]MBO4169453.1 hypothetical protein [Cereibacter azotoformans]PTR18130.1 hypothetical protein C8J28_10987 [Cereibacter azotoformans]UIJ31163.1 hypothetical protein LV780_03000 [Cereibacter azotoformans]ULB08964.1 hypothetical protein ORIO_03330 [Cereibacter azotoformans]